MRWNGKTVVAIGGGKGGIGKSSFAANLGVVLSRKNRSVVLVDADLGAANLHTLTGVTYPEKTLDDFIRGRRKNLEDTLIPSPYPNLSILSSASDILSIASPNYAQRQKLFRALNNLSCDTIIFDIAAGTHTRAIDFFSLAPNGVIIVEPTPTSLENAYSFLKNLMVRHLLRVFYHDKRIRDFIHDATDTHNPQHFLLLSELTERLMTMAPEKTAQYRQQITDSICRTYLVVNAIRTPSQFQIADRFARMAKRYLALEITVLGALPFESRFDEAIVARTPFIVKFPQSPYARGVEHIADRLISGNPA